MFTEEEEEEDKWSCDPKTIYHYALQGHRLYQWQEEALSQDGYYALRYATDVLKKRFYLGESSILQNDVFAFHYAKAVIKGRWEEGEAIIAEYNDCAYWYAIEVLKKRFKLGEPAIRKHPTLWRQYCDYFDIYVVDNIEWSRHGF